MLLYVDPPYTTDTRVGRRYRHEVTLDHHQLLLGALKKCRATVVLSGYDNPLYRRQLGDWWVEMIPASTQQGRWAGGQARTELLWLNREPPNTLFSLTELADPRAGADPPGN